MKINDILTEAPKKKKKVAKKKAAKKTNPYKPTVVADIDLSAAAIAAAEKIATFAKKNCAPWLATTKNGKDIVYRGISDRAGLAFTKKTRDDRRPKDTGQVRHNAFNAAIAAAGGVANRSNSLFCSGDDDTAKQYGRAYVLLPVGKFNYTWGSEWSDWTGDAELDDLQDLLAPKKQSADVQKKIAALRAQISAYKATLLKTAELDYTKRLANLTKDIGQYKKKLAQEKAKSKQNQSYWKIEDYQYEIESETQTLKNLKTPAGKKSYIAHRIEVLLDVNSDSPQYKIQQLVGDPTDRSEKDTLDPKNYDPKKVREMIIADQKISQAISSGMEIMIRCNAGLYVKPNFYKKFVLPLLQGKKITAKYNPENEDDDDDDGYW